MNDDKIYILLQIILEMNKSGTRLQHGEWDAVYYWVKNRLFELINPKT